MSTSLTGEETHTLDGNEVEDVNSRATCLGAPITSKEVARQVRAATDCLSKPLERLCDLKREFRRDTIRHGGGTSAPAQGLSGPRGANYDMLTGALLATRSETLTGPMNLMMRQPDNITSTRQQPNRTR